MTIGGHLVNLLSGNSEDRCDITHAQRLVPALDQFDQLHDKVLAFPSSTATGSRLIMGRVRNSVKLTISLPVECCKDKKSAEEFLRRSPTRRNQVIRSGNERCQRSSIHFGKRVSRLDAFQIHHGGLDAAVSHPVLQSADVDAVAQVLGSEGVPEFV